MNENENEVRPDLNRSLSIVLKLETEGYEDEEEFIRDFQFLIDTGIVWNLQGSYGALAHRLIERGVCTNG